MKYNHFESLQKNLLSREEELFNTAIKEIYDRAVSDTSRRGVLGPGVGAAFVEHELLKAVRERMKEVAVELAEVELKANKLRAILRPLFDQYISQTENLLEKPAVWGPQKNEESQRHLKRWTDQAKPALWSYFESEFGASLTKRRISTRIKIRETFMWLVIGAVISRFWDLITLTEKAICALKDIKIGS